MNVFPTSLASMIDDRTHKQLPELFPLMASLHPELQLRTPTGSPPPSAPRPWRELRCYLPARAREDALLQVERLYCRLRISSPKLRAMGLSSGLEQLCERSERYLAELQMVRERAALSEDEGQP